MENRRREQTVEGRPRDEHTDIARHDDATGNAESLIEESAAAVEQHTPGANAAIHHKYLLQQEPTEEKSATLDQAERKSGNGMMRNHEYFSLSAARGGRWRQIVIRRMPSISAVPTQSIFVFGLGLGFLFLVGFEPALIFLHQFVETLLGLRPTSLDGLSRGFASLLRSEILRAGLATLATERYGGCILR